MIHLKNYFGIVMLVLTAIQLSGCKSSADTTVSKSISYNNPIASQRADPWVYKDTDDTYYFIATAPEYDRIEIRESQTINGLGTAPAKTVWSKHTQGNMGAHIWAPELHKIDGTWYIYFAAGDVEDVWKIRVYALSNTSANPMEGEWVEEGQIKLERDSFSLDATTFEHQGERYMIWAQNVREGENTSIVLSKMESPIKLKGEELVISDPEYDWERRGYKVNEGPAVLKRNGKIFVTYSASATDANYAIGLLWADESADLMKKDSWHKAEKPVFYTNEDVRRYGPGHNSFTIAEDGKTDVMIYHARVYKDIRGDALSDFNRHTRARIIKWDKDGFPNFRQTEGD